MIRIEARAQPSQMMAYATPLLAVLLTMLFGGILFAVLGKDPVAAI
ncbi:MAG: ABC transporter permease, partial [Pseudomonadota bacterium]